MAITEGTSWRRVATDPEYLAAVVADEAQVDAWVDVLAPDGAHLARLGGDGATLPGVVAGSVTCDGSAHIRWTGDLTIDNSDLVPHRPGDLFHPLSWNRARPWWAVRLPSGVWAAVPLGTMFIDVDDPVDDGSAEVALSLRLSDAAAVIKRNRMPGSVDVGGLPAEVAAMSVLDQAAPWGATFDLSPLGNPLPAGFEAGEPDADPWQVAHDMVTAAGGRLFVDRDGTIVVEPDTSPATSRAEFREGPGCRATSVTTSTDLDQVYNVVTVTTGARKDADGEDIEPIAYTAEDTDETSPTWVGHGFIMRHPVIEADEATTYAQVKAIAEARLAEYRTPVQHVTLEAVPHVHLDPSDPVDLAFSRVGASGRRTVRSWTVQLGPAGGQRIECVGRRETW